MTILIIGNKGQLGWSLERKAANEGLDTLGVDLPDLDLTNAEAVNQLVVQDRFAAIVNAAAYTAVDKAESDFELAFAVNRDGVAILADACRSKQIPLIHISTDYVFNGRGEVPYRPEDPIDPLGVYGKSKAAGESEVCNRLKQHLIIRTSWLYGNHGNNFVKTMLRLAREREELRVVDDQFGCPTFAGDLADAIIKIIKQIIDRRKIQWGTNHYCNAGVITWHQFAKMAILLASKNEKFKVEKVLPIKTEEYPTPAPRPAYSALDCTSLSVSFGIETIPWADSLARMIDGLYAAM